jgi:hypothetical protein
VREPARFDEHLKSGELSVTILGNYFHNSFVLELAHTAKALSPRARQVFLCTAEYREALTPFLEANGIENVEYAVFDPSSPILLRWARDIAVGGGRAGERIIVVSPDKHAQSKETAEATADALQRILPDRHIRVASFAFETGNLAFVETPRGRVLIAGRKIVFDNEAYQRRAWAAGHDSRALLEVAAETFEVDTVIVVGRAPTRPDTRMYFEYHIDMGMVVLRGNRAVVSRLEYGDRERAALFGAVDRRHPIITPFLTADMDAETLARVLSERLDTVVLEYEAYAAVLESLGVQVHRSPVGWQHVLASMSWTNVLQVGDRIVMPLYPDSLYGITKSTRSEGGLLEISLDVSAIGEERFELNGFNERNYGLYRSLGYEVVTAPEYLHYMMGGIHCLTNVLE